MNILTPLILIIICIGTFFGYIDPNYRGKNLTNGKLSITELRDEDVKYKKALADAKTLGEKRDTLQAQIAGFEPVAVEKLEKLLPDNIDNIKLIIDLNNIATKHNLDLKGLKVDMPTKSDSNTANAQENKIGTIGISFSVQASYESFKSLLADLEKSLRLVEITDLSVTGSDTALYEYSISLKTYWLR